MLNTVMLYFSEDAGSTKTDEMKEEEREETPMEGAESHPGHVHDADPTYSWGRGNVMEGEGQQAEGIVKPVLSGHSKRRPKLVFKTDYGLMQVKSIAECSKGSILQYFRPSLSYLLSLVSLFCLFMSGPLRQVLL